MINFLKQQRVLLILVLGLFFIHLCSRDITSPYERPISGDAQAYYSYLPAVFIYQDLDYTFIKTEAAKHYGPLHIKDFIMDVDGEKVNKTFPGVAVLYSPFFFAGHLSALVLGKPADGFSSVYQLWFDIGIWTYFFFGLVFMRKVLEKLQFSIKNALFTTILIALATNLFFYTVYDQSVTHVHNFFMINGLILCLLNFRSQAKTKWLIIAFGLFVLIGITRPTNVLVVGLIFFFFPTVDFYKSILKSIFSKEIWKFALVGLPIIALPFVLWKAQTGNWVVYSYGEEGFDFANPHFFEFIFSYTKGWMTYTPFVIPVLVLGLFFLFKESKKRFTIAIVFYLLTIYVFSSWWCWYYGAGMSQRVMIDHYILLAFLVATCYKHLCAKPILKKVSLALAVLLVFFNIAQAFQINNGILQFGSATKEQYWDNFLVLEKCARVYPKEHWELVEEVAFNSNPPIKGDNFEKSGLGYETTFDEQNTYSAVFKEELHDVNVGDRSNLILSFEMLAETEIENSRAVITMTHDLPGTSPEGMPLYFKGYVKPQEWVKMEFLIPAFDTFEPEVELFFWNGDSKEKARFRKFKITHYKTDSYM